MQPHSRISWASYITLYCKSWNKQEEEREGWGSHLSCHKLTLARKDERLRKQRGWWWSRTGNFHSRALAFYMSGMDILPPRVEIVTPRYVVWVRKLFTWNSKYMANRSAAHSLYNLRFSHTYSHLAASGSSLAPGSIDLWISLLMKKE